MMAAFRPSLALTLAACALLAGCNKESSPEEAAMSKDFQLVSASIEPPDWSEEQYPEDPGAEAMDNNCRACHSPSMVLVQPPLTHEEWVKEVDKMRDTFKASIDENDVPAILGYLDDFSKKQAAAASGS